MQPLQLKSSWGATLHLAEGEGSAVVTGVALPYRPAVAKTAMGGLDAAEPGCVQMADVVTANLQHRRDQPLGRRGVNLEFEDTAEGLKCSLDLGPVMASTHGSNALVGIQTGLISGFSVEILLLDARREGNTRIWQSCILEAVSLVDRPAFSDARLTHSAPPQRPPAQYW